MAIDAKMSLLSHESIDTTMEYVQTLGEDAKLKYLQYVG